MDLDDPGHDARLRDHSGYHPATLMHVAQHLPEEQLKNLAKGCYHWAECRRGGDSRNLVIVPICRRERHRSVAARELIRAYLDQQNVSNAEIKDGPFIKFPKHFCENSKKGLCDACKHFGSAHMQSWHKAVKVFSDRMEKVHKYYRTKGTIHLPKAESKRAAGG